MKAVQIKNGKGPATSLFIDEYPDPELKPGSVLIKVHAFGLNRMDLMQREGLYPIPEGVSTILGVEFSGIVIDGNNSKEFKNGDEVFGLAYCGAYAEKIVTSTKTLLHKPKELSFEETAGICEVWITATQALNYIGGIKKDQNILLHAGASAVSIAAIQIAQFLEINTIFTTIGSDEKQKFVENDLIVKNSSGLKNKTKIIGINYHEEDFEKKINSLDNGNYKQKINYILDPVAGGGYIEKDLNVLGLDSKLVLLAIMGGNKTKEPIDLLSILIRRIEIIGTTLRARSEDYQYDILNIFRRDYLPQIINGNFKIFIDKVFDWKDIVKAHQYMETSQSKGKIIVKVTN